MSRARAALPVGPGRPRAFALPRLLHQGCGGVLRRGARRSMRSSAWLHVACRRSGCGPAASRADHPGRARDLRRGGARGLRGAELDGLPLLQLADVGHAQTELRPRVRWSTALPGSRSSTTCSRGCGSRSRWGSPQRCGLLADFGARRRRASGCSASWLGLGALELILHDVGNERRFVIFIPALVALAALVAWPPIAALLPADGGLDTRARGRFSRRRSWPTRSYVIFGSIVRLAFLYEVSPNVRIGGGPGRPDDGRDSTPPGRGVPRMLSRTPGAPRAGMVLASVPRGRAGWCSTASGRRAGPTRTTRRSSRLGRCAAARHARPRQAGQRAVARESDQAGLRRARSSATTRTGSAATMCDIF